MSAVSCGLMPPPPNAPVVTTRSPPKLRSIVSSIEACSDAANTVNSVTTATPTISADAVPAVRRGLRMAFWRASPPVMPRRRATGAPRTDAAGRAATRAEHDRAHHREHRAEPHEGQRVAVAQGGDAASGPRHRRPTGRRPPRGPGTARCARQPRRAAPPAAPPARPCTPGTTPATSVTTMPTAKATAAVPPVTTMPPAGSENPAASKRPLSSPAMSTPAPSPTARRRRPTSDGLGHHRPAGSGPRRAPRARSSAAWRVRWATMIEKVL